MHPEPARTANQRSRPAEELRAAPDSRVTHGLRERGIQEWRSVGRRWAWLDPRPKEQVGDIGSMCSRSRGAVLAIPEPFSPASGDTRICTRWACSSTIWRSWPPAKRSTTWASIRGDERTRTADPLLAKQVLYRLSYVPALPFGNCRIILLLPVPQLMTLQHLTRMEPACERMARAFPSDRVRRRPSDGGVVPTSPSSRQRLR